MKPSEYFVYFEGFIPHLRDKRSAQSAKGLLDCRTIKNRTPKIRCALYRTLIFRLPPDLAPFPFGQVAGFHRAVPSTALDKACMQFSSMIIHVFFKMSTFFPCHLTFFAFYDMVLSPYHTGEIRKCVTYFQN